MINVEGENKQTEIQRDSTERQRDWEIEKQGDRETGRQRDRETERQGDRETERQRDRKTDPIQILLTMINSMYL